MFHLDALNYSFEPVRPMVPEQTSAAAAPNFILAQKEARTCLCSAVLLFSLKQELESWFNKI